MARLKFAKNPKVDYPHSKAVTFFYRAAFVSARIKIIVIAQTLEN